MTIPPLPAFLPTDSEKKNYSSPRRQEQTQEQLRFDEPSRSSVTISSHAGVGALIRLADEAVKIRPLLALR